MDVRIISATEHLAFIRTRPSVSFLQTPAWGKVKNHWKSESIGWFKNNELIGVGLVLMRKVPRLNKYFAYLPEGPDLDWENSNQVEHALKALVEFGKAQNFFQIKIGPHVWAKRWQAETLKDAIATGNAKRITEVAPDAVNTTGMALIETLKQLGWKQPAAVDEGFGDYQPRHVFQLDLTNKSADDIFNNFNQLWRRNIRKAEKLGVSITAGSTPDIAQFHDCYVETAKRDHFTPRPLSYFENMYQVMREEDEQRIELYLAHHPDFSGAVAATTMTRVGNHAWYSYGASTTASRDLRPSNAIQWHMIQQAISAGCSVYDLRGIADTLDADHHLFGLIQFKLGTGGYAQEYVGEWDFNISPLLAKAFSIYMARRG